MSGARDYIESLQEKLREKDQIITKLGDHYGALLEAKDQRIREAERTISELIRRKQELKREAAECSSTNSSKSC